MDSDGNMHVIDKNTGGGMQLFIFISPECPFCVNYTKTLNDLASKFESENISYAAVVSGDEFTDNDVNEFRTEYGFKFPVLMDHDNKLAKMLGATVTPEVFLMDREGGLIYSGAIDNWAVDTGRKRRVVSEHYLQDAIIAALHGTKPDPSHKDAVGCYIEL